MVNKFIINRYSFINLIVLFFTSVFLFFVFIILSLVYDVHASSKRAQQYYAQDQLTNEVLCQTTKCYGIIQHDTLYLYSDSRDVQLTTINENFLNNVHLWGRCYFNTGLYKFNIEVQGRYVIFTLFRDINKGIFMLQVLAPLILVFIFLYTIFILNYERKRNIVLNAANEALASHRSMMLLSENIHHELNTPVEVIENKVKKIQSKLLKEGYDYTPEFNFIYTSIDQITNILNKMKELKKIRQSNEDYNISDLLRHILMVSHINDSSFNYMIDKRLAQYKCAGGLNNSDLLNILLNHVKNSLEATATVIEVDFEKFEEDMLHFLIKDDGNGIDDHFRKHIFEPNFSTKGDFSMARGNGMYLNKTILNNIGGDVELVFSRTGEGTTIRLIIPAEIIH